MVVAALIGLLTIALWMALRDRASPPPSGVAGSERSLPVAGVPIATSGGGEADESAELAPPTAQSEPQLHRESVAAGDHRIRGRVLDPMGRPAEGALAGVVGILGDQPAQSGDTATATCDAAGSFVLDVPPSLMGELLVIGRQKGFRPAWLRVARDAIPGDLELRLEVGCVIEGVVLRNGAALPGASLLLDLRYGVPGVFGVGSEAFWLAGRFEEKHFGAVADDQGRFRITGLAPDEYRCALGVPDEGSSPDPSEIARMLSRLPGNEGRRLRESDPAGIVVPLDGSPTEVSANRVLQVASFVRQVRAPDPALVIDLTTAELAVSARRPDGVIAGARLRVRCGGQTATADCGGDEPTIVAVPPGAKVELTLEHPRSRSVAREVIAPGPGQRLELVLDLEPVARPSLSVHSPSALTARVEAIPIELRSASTGERTTLVARRTPAGDAYFAPVLPVDPGEYDLIVCPGGEASAMLLQPRVRAVQVPEAGALEVTVELALAGRCEVVIEAPGEWTATYRLVDGAGRRWKEGNKFGGPNRGGAWTIEMFRRADEPSAATRAGVVPVGEYTLEVDAPGFLPCRVPVVVEAGKTTRAEARLQPIP